MRATLHRSWPALTMHYGLCPDDVSRFSLAEWKGYLDALADLQSRS